MALSDLWGWGDADFLQSICYEVSQNFSTEANPETGREKILCKPAGMKTIQ